MKTLLLMRHAKSSHDDGLPDHERPLNGRGKKDAPRMGQWLAGQGLLPDHILTSTAKRAVDTAKRVAEALRFQGDVEQRGVLYHASPETWLDALHSLPDERRCILCVGHNPGLELLVAELTGEPQKLPTAAIAYFTLQDEGWSEILPESPNLTLEVLWKPKSLPGQ
jgi:phosphohistidine phosphatase